MGAKMRYMSEYERQNMKLRKIKNWLTVFAMLLIFIGLQGFMPLPRLESTFFIFTGNACIFWVALVDEDKRLFLFTLLMIIAQISRIYYEA